MVMARWPNANFYDETIWNKEDHWGHGTIDEDPEAYHNGMLIDAPHGDINLAESGLDIMCSVSSQPHMKPLFWQPVMKSVVS